MTATQAPTPGPLSGDDDLLPCPFCGDDVIVTDHQEVQDAETYYWHRCAGCGVESEGAHGATAALAQWNLRVQAERLAPTAPVEASVPWQERKIEDDGNGGYRYVEPACRPVEASGSERNEAIQTLIDGYAVMHKAICFMAGTSGADSRWYYEKANDAFAKTKPLHVFSEALDAALRPQPIGETRDAVARIEAFLGSVRGLIRQEGHTLDPADLRALLSARPLALEGQQGEGARFRHKKRGTLYTLVGGARLQCTSPLPDMSEIVVYRGDDGDLWARANTEFWDGRFECVSVSTTPARAEAQDEGAAGEKNLGWFAGFARKHGHHAQADWLDNYARAHPSPPPAADEDRVRIAVEALEPFKLAANNMDGDEPDSLFIYDSPESTMISYGDLRRAASVHDALKSTAAKEGERS